MKGFWVAFSVLCLLFLVGQAKGEEDSPDDLMLENSPDDLMFEDSPDDLIIENSKTLPRMSREICYFFTVYGKVQVICIDFLDF